MYLKEGDRLRKYSKITGYNTRTERFVPTAELYPNLHPTANRLASIYPKTNWIVKEQAQLWKYHEQEPDTINFDPYKGPFYTIDAAFYDSFLSS